MGRPTSLTPELGRKLVSLVRGGHSPSSAARMVGVNSGTVSRWLRRTEPEYRNFRRAIKRARSMHERRLLARIDNASRDPKHWTAAAWILERLHPEKYALRVHRAVETEREAMRAVLREHLEEQQFTEVARALLAAQQSARGRGREHVSPH